MNRSILFVCMALMCALGRAGYWDGYYVPDMDEVTHLTSFEKANVSMGATWGDTVPVHGTISKTSSSGVTKLDFSYTHPVYGRQTVKWSGQIYWWDIPEFTYGGHRYWICFDAIPLGMQVCVDQDSADEKYFWCEVHLVNENPTVPVEWQKARKLTGVFGEGCGRNVAGAEGTCELTCGKANKKGYAKVALKITPFTGKKISYSASSVYVGAGGRVKVNFKNRYTVSIDSDGSFFGEPYYADIRPSCSPRAVWSATVGGEYYGTAYFDFGDVPEEIDGNWVLYPMGICEMITMSGKRWSLAKAATMKWKKCPPYADCGPGSWDVNTSGGKTNISGLKLTYNSKTGLFKGSFTLYTWSQGGKKYKVTVNGLMVDGLGYGEAVVKKPSTAWAVSVNR